MKAPMSTYKVVGPMRIQRVGDSREEAKGELTERCIGEDDKKVLVSVA